MAAETSLPPQNFLGLPEKNSRFEDSAVLVLPIPYDGTTSYRSGAKDGPRAIIEASRQVELYDAEFQKECALQWGIHTLPAIAPDHAGPEATVARIESVVADHAGSGKLLAILGGEHSISIGVARALRRVHGDFVTVQLDAHADLRDSYDGTPYSHACAARRIVEQCGSHVVQLGIRSVDFSEAAYIGDHPQNVTTIFAETMHTSRDWLDLLKERVAGKPVFLTVDLDAFDPAIMPATGTPEPDGLSYRTVLEIIRMIAAEARIIAFDCVELAPIPGLHHPDFTTAKLVYKIINLIMRQRSQET